MTNRVEFTSPVGRLVGGDVYTGNTTDMEGNPLVVKSGANKGQPRINFYIGVAVPKNPNVPWEYEPWGQIIMQVALTVQNAFDPATGQLYPGRDFAFKVTDGDSQIPNKKNKRPCDQEGYAGHWVLNFSNGFAPKGCNADGSEILPNGAIKRGYFVQVLCSVIANANSNNPGVYLNHEAVALAGYGEEIFVGADTSKAGFGQNTVAPQGMTQQPPAGMTQTPPIQQQQGQQPPIQQQQGQQPPVQQQQGQQPPVQQHQGQQPPPPANDMVNPIPPIASQTPIEQQYIYQGKQYGESEMLSWNGWTPQHLASLQKV